MVERAVVINDRRVSRDEVDRVARQAASALHELGVGPGSTVAILMINDFPLIEATLAARLLGAHTVPLNWHNKPDELAYVLGDSCPSVLIGHAGLLAPARSVIPDGTQVLVVPDAPGTPSSGSPESDEAAVLADVAGARRWTDFLADCDEWLDDPPTATGSVIYTSGTTGRPKGVRRAPMDQDQYERFREVQNLVFGFGPGRRTLVLGPAYHTLPDSSWRLSLEQGDLTVMQSRLDPEGVLRAIERYAITNMALVPTVFVRLLKLPAAVRERYDVSSLTSVTHAGAPCPPEVKRQMIAWWGPVINEIYGGTEMGTAFFCTAAEWLAHPGTVGRALPGAHFEIVRPDGGLAGVGEPGEIYASNPGTGEFEYIGSQLERDAITRGQMVTLGDVGHVDADGFLYLSDRKRDMVIAGGVNIYPAEIEAALLGHPGVLDCAVFGIPDDDLGETLIAVIQPVPDLASPLDKDVITHWLRARLSNYKVPREIRFTSELPREESGKIFKRKLRDPYWADRERAI